VPQCPIAGDATEDRPKTRIEILWNLVSDTEQSIVAKFPKRGWKLCSVEAICKRVDERDGSATERKPASDRSKTARTEENVSC